VSSIPKLADDGEDGNPSAPERLTVRPSAVMSDANPVFDAPRKAGLRMRAPGNPAVWPLAVEGWRGGG